MSPAVCFRCDWQGITRRRVCPSCGAPLYVRQREAEPVRAHEAGPERPERRRRSLPAGMSIGLALVLAVAVVATIQAFPKHASERPTPEVKRQRAASDPAMHAGSLVYLTAPEDEPPSLWVVDLQAAGGAAPGPRVPEGTRELVDLSKAGPGWVGIERAARGRRTWAAAVHGVAPDARVVGLGRGDLVAWGPEGTSLVFARNGRVESNGCAPVRINLVTVATRREEWALDDPGFCGPVLSLSRSSAATYFTAASGDRLSVYLTGAVGVPHLMFDGLGVLSAAPPSAFLLSAKQAQDTVGAEPGRDPTLLGWKGIGGPISVGDGDHVFTVERILSWSRDGSLVALVGRLGDRDGVFVVSAGAGTGPRVPRYVMPQSRAIDATFDAGGALYLAADGLIVVDRGGELTRVRLPQDAPPPVGPIVWIP